MTTLEELLHSDRPSHRRGCRVCGEPVAALVRVQIVETNGKGIQKGAASRSHGASFCAEHAAVVFTDACARLGVNL